MNTDTEVVETLFEIDETPRLEARFNIAPTQTAPVVWYDADAESGGRVMSEFRWGLVPFWADDEKIGNRMINARSETVADKPAFKAAYKYRRCLIPASGFYEWQKRDDGSKQPYYIHPADDEELFAFAGLHESWTDTDGDELRTYTILTTDANEMMKKLHDRMPVILEPEDFEAWLATDPDEASELTQLLKPASPDRMAAHPVSRRVNKPQNDDPENVEAVEAQRGLFE